MVAVDERQQRRHEELLRFQLTADRHRVDRAHSLLAEDLRRCADTADHFYKNAREETMTPSSAADIIGSAYHFVRTCSNSYLIELKDLFDAPTTRSMDDIDENLPALQSSLPVEKWEDHKPALVIVIVRDMWSLSYSARQVADGLDALKKRLA